MKGVLRLKVLDCFAHHPVPSRGVHEGVLSNAFQQHRLDVLPVPREGDVIPGLSSAVAADVVSGSVRHTYSVPASVRTLNDPSPVVYHRFHGA